MPVWNKKKVLFESEKMNTAKAKPGVQSSSLGNIVISVRTRQSQTNFNSSSNILLYTKP